MTMNLKPKPIKPERGTLTDYDNVSNFSTLADVIQWAENFGSTADKVWIEDVGSYDGAHYKFVVEYPEDDESYNKKLKQYEKKLASWNKWYEQNKETIDAELARQEGELTEKMKKELAKRVKKLKKEQAKIESELHRLTKS